MAAYEVRNWEEAQSLLSSLTSSGKISLIIPQFSVTVYGIPYIKSFIDTLYKNYMTRIDKVWVDCGAYSGYVMMGIRQGITHMLFTGNKEALRKLQEMASPLKGCVTDQVF